MEPVFIGYFPKRKTPPPEGYDCHQLKDICSVSECIAVGPPKDWISYWLHNSNWVFSSRALALQVLGGADPNDYSIHAYRILPLEFDANEVRPLCLAVGQASWENADCNIEAIPSEYESLGFDAVACSTGNSFECSPLSCNHGCKEFETNEHCLVSTLERAIDLAKIFAKGNWEPGPYRVVEVLGPRQDPAYVY